jgi:hypothetical protein
MIYMYMIDDDRKFNKFDKGLIKLIIGCGCKPYNYYHTTYHYFSLPAKKNTLLKSHVLKLKVRKNLGGSNNVLFTRYNPYMILFNKNIMLGVSRLLEHVLLFSARND